MNRKLAFERLEFNPKALDPSKFGVREITMLEFYEKLRDIKEFMDYDQPDRDLYIKYIVYVYSPESPFVDVYKDIDQRKEAAFKESGFNKQQVTLNKFKKVKQMRNKAVNRMIFAYLRFKNNLVWTNLCTAEQAYYNITKLIMLPPDDLTQAGKINSLMEDQDKISKRINDYWKELFLEDEQGVEAVKKERIIYNPEGVAEDLEEELVEQEDD